MWESTGNQRLRQDSKKRQQTEEPQQKSWESSEGRPVLRCCSNRSEPNSALEEAIY
ncbi:UNVERIFIED_CONTAM: hypothetical protein FKN15_041207 [Acipenser sinensis]